MTTENVAVLFTDMVGSTALASGLSVDDADDLRRGHFTILRRAVTESGGSEVKNLGDGLMVVFTSASAALSCAVMMQQSIEHDNRAQSQPVGLRVGLSAGEVTVEDDDYFGDPVVAAARLCARCESGQVLSADVVRLTAGRRSRHEYRAVGEVTLKGLPDPVEAVEVVWTPLEPLGPGGRVPLPTRLAVRPAVGVVGRASESAALSDAFARVAAAAGREVVLVSGEAGQGKTTVVAAAAQDAFAAEACVLFGHCEQDLATPYQLFVEALGHLVTHASEEQLVAHVEAHGSELARLVPALTGRMPDLPRSRATDTDSERYLLFAAVVGILVQLSPQQPIVLVLDDLQWADKASLQLLRHLVATEHPMRLLVLGTYRDSELSHVHPLLETLAALRRQDGVARLELAGLDGAGVVSLMEAAAGHALDGAAIGLAHAVHRETDGNPFFVTEVLRHLNETGAIYQDGAGQWVADDRDGRLTLPDSVREVIGTRVGRLGHDAGRVLSVAAVIGRDFDLEVLARASGTAEDDVLDVLDAAAEVALVREVSDTPGHYSFAHALIQHTLYEDLGLTRRARAHREVALAIEAVSGDRPGSRVGELARHWSNAIQPIDLVKAVSYARQAADAALAALAPDDALGYYAQALGLHAQAAEPDPVLDLDLGIGLGTAQRQTGDPSFRDTLLDVARRAAALGDTTRLVAAALANSRGWSTAIGVVDADKVAILETALDRLPPDQTERALVLATLCAELSWGSPLERRQALADEALAIAHASGDDATIVRVLNDVALPLSVPHLLEQSSARTAEALARAERLGDPVLLFFAAVWRAQTVALAGDLVERDVCIDRAGALADQLGQPTLNWSHTLNLAWRAMSAGDISGAEQMATEALQIGADSGQPDADAYFGMQYKIVSWQRGTMGDLVPLIEQTLADMPELAGAIRAAQALAYAEGDRSADATELLTELAGRGFELPLDQAWLAAMADYAEAAIEARDGRHAAPLFERLEPWADLLACNGTTVEGPVSQYLGGLAALLGRHDEADGYFGRAAAFSEHWGGMFFAARTRVWWARMLVERGQAGDADRARQLLEQARVLAAANGYANVERRAVAALDRLA